jgi:hypothetical protein
VAKYEELKSATEGASGPVSDTERQRPCLESCATSVLARGRFFALNRHLEKPEDLAA